MRELPPVPKDVNELSHAVIGCAIEVRRVLGPGFLESAYERAMCIELRRRGIFVEDQKTFVLQYLGEKVGDVRPDLVVEHDLIVELKCVEAFAAIHYAQTTSYLRATGLPLALLLNFEVPIMREGIRRVINPYPRSAVWSATSNLSNS